jgi:hypothetical protein
MAAVPAELGLLVIDPSRVTIKQELSHGAEGAVFAAVYAGQNIVAKVTQRSVVCAFVLAPSTGCAFVGRVCGCRNHPIFLRDGGVAASGAPRCICGVSLARRHQQ